MLYQIALSLIKHLPTKLINEIRNNEGDDISTYKELENLVANSNTKTAHKIKLQLQSKKILLKAESIIKECEKHGIEIASIYSDNYPELLKECPDKPNVIYTKGNINSNNQILIAIVGTRNCTKYGLDICKEFISEFNNYNIGIVSGLAYGIDIQVHKIANKLKIPNYAVLGSGVNITYPKAHSNHANDIVENGMLISEFPPNSPPVSYNFPRRNRIIAGMAKCTLVIESSLKGGSIITAKLANDYNREVFAIPGNINKINSQGCNHLIYNHQAHLISHPKKIIELLNLENKKTAIKPCKPSLNKQEKEIYELLKTENKVPFNNIQSKLNISTSSLNTILTTMELEDLIIQLPGKIYTLM